MLCPRVLGLFLVASILSAQSTIKVDVQLVQMGFSVRDATGELRTDLGPEAIDVFEDGERQEVARFSAADRLPLRMGLLIDASGSQDSFRETHYGDLRVFLDSVLGLGDGVFVVGFGNRLRLIAPLTADADAVLHRADLYRRGTRFPAVGPEERRSGGTGFFDALYHSIHEQFTVADAGRRALVVLSDGADNSSRYNLMDAIDAAQAKDVRIFNIWYAEHDEDSIRIHYGNRVMQRLAENTGGELLVRSGGDLGEHFSRIADILRSSYELGYYSTNTDNDGRFRQVEIRTKDPALTVHAKPGYFAR